MQLFFLQVNKSIHRPVRCNMKSILANVFVQYMYKNYILRCNTLKMELIAHVMDCQTRRFPRTEQAAA